MHITRRPLAALAIAIALSGLAACGSGDDQASSGSGPADTADHGSDMGGMDMGGTTTFEFGSAAHAADADRTVDVTADDTFRFAPASVSISKGETILFQVRNTGKVVHEFVLGDDSLQDEHEAEMKSMADSMRADEPNGISIAPGKTKELAFTFTKAGLLKYGCHEAGHYAAGMVGTITVT